MQFARKGFLSIILSLFCLAMLCGCVTRSLTIDSEPPGAMVYLDDEPIGETPVTTSFTYYGTRKITLEKTDPEGRLLFKRRIIFEKIKRPYYQIFPLSFFSELVIPANIKDEHYLKYRLELSQVTPWEELRKQVLENAEELRDRYKEGSTHER